MTKKIMKLSPGRILALGFVAVILIGSGLFMLPCSVKEGYDIRYIDALYTSASAVCVTGLVTFDPGTALTPIGYTILAILIQIGGLGVATVGAGVMLAMGKKINLKGRNVIREAGNLENGKGVVRFVQSVLLTTIIITLVGAAFNFIVFVREYSPLQALGYSLFHSIAAFNNSGFDVLGNSGQLNSNESLFIYHDNILLNLVTTGLIILGSMGFLVLREMRSNKFHWKKYSMHAKIVLSVNAFLIIFGTMMIKLTEGSETWLGAYFQSVATRTAGFSTTNIGTYTEAGLLVMMVLMFIGASPGSTGGGVKTTTFFVLLQGVLSAATNRTEKAFKYTIPRQLFRKAAVIVFLGLTVVLSGTWLMIVMEPNMALRDALFEAVSAFGTVGLSTGITSTLSTGSKILSIVIMFIGRLGPLTIASLWYFGKGERINYPEGNIAIG